MDRATEEERYEALAKRYVDAARVVLLTNKRYAVFSMARGEILGVVEKEELAQAVELACARSGEYWEAEQQAMRDRRRAETEFEAKVVPGAKSAADLGL